MEPAPPTVEVPSPNHWTTREFPVGALLRGYEADLGLGESWKGLGDGTGLMGGAEDVNSKGS